MGNWRKISAAGTSTTTGVVHPNSVTLGVPSFNRQTQELSLPWTKPSAPQPTKLLVLGEFPTQANALTADGTEAADGTRAAVGTPTRTDLGYHSAADDSYPLRIVLPEPLTAEMTARIFVVAATEEVTNDLDGSPSVSLLVGPPEGVKIGSGVEYGPLVQDLRGTIYTEQVGAGWFWWFELAWQIPIGDPRYERVASWNVVLFDSSIRTRRDGSRYSLVSSEPVTKDNYTLDTLWEIPDTPTTYRLYLQTKEKDQYGGRLNQIVPAVTPYVEFTPVKSDGAAGAEKAGTVTGIAASAPEYVKNGQGLLTLRIVLRWNKPSDPRYGGCKAYVWTPGETAPGRVASGLETGSSLAMEFTDFPSSTQLWHFAVLSVDQNNLENTYVNGVTPETSISVSPPSTGNLPLVTSPSVTRTYSTNVDGVEQFVMSGFASPPSATTYPEFAGCKMVARDTLDSDPIGRDHVLAYTGTNCQFRTEPLPIGSPTVFDVYFVSVDVNGKENDLVPGVTPRVAGISVGVQTSGSIKMNRMSAATFDTDEFKIDVDDKFKMDKLSVDKLIVGTILKLGGGASPKPAQFGIFDESESLIVWGGKKADGIGGYWIGLYGQRAWFGGTNPSDANIDINGTSVDINNAIFTLTLNGVETRIGNDSDGSDIIGLSVSNLSDDARTVIYPGAASFLTYLGNTGVAVSAARTAFDRHGEITVYGAPLSPDVQIYANGIGGFIDVLSGGAIHMLNGFSVQTVTIDQSKVEAPEFRVSGQKVVGNRQAAPAAASISGISGVTGTVGSTYGVTEQVALQALINTSLPNFNALVSLYDTVNAIRSILILHGLMG